MIRLGRWTSLLLALRKKYKFRDPDAPQRMILGFQREGAANGQATCRESVAHGWRARALSVIEHSLSLPPELTAATAT
jgi:hypothetical protein